MPALSNPRIACRVWIPLLSILLVALASAAGGTLVDDFENPDTFSRWSFYNGGEFPGATGSLTRGSGHFGAGAHLVCDFSGGGAYVSANVTLPTPLNGVAVAFWVKSPARIRVRLRVNDSTGQTLQYALNRPLWQMDPEAWYRHVVRLDSPDGWWGGTNDGQVHLPIRAINILAGDALESRVVGAIDFDDLELLDSIAVTVDPSAQPVIAAPRDSGSLQSRLGVNIHFTSDNRALDIARAAGIQWVRMDLIWSSVERQSNVFNWTSFDGLVQSLEARGMNALFILDYGNSLYTGTNSPTTPDQVDAFARYAEAAARHFAGHNVLFEIWNEPNIGFWKPAPDTNQYAALARAVIPAIKRGDPAAKVLTGGLAGFDHKFFRGFLSLGGGDGADGVGVHPYLRTPESITDHLLTYRAIVAELLSHNPPVYDTEWGYTSCDFGDGHDPVARHRQGVMVPRRLLASWAAGLPLMIYYDIRDDGLDSTEREHNFGLIANDYSDKPAIHAVRTLSAVCSNRVLTGFLPLNFPNLVAMRLDGPSNVVIALWPDTDGGEIPIDVPLNSTAHDVLGRPLQLDPGSDGLRLIVRQTNSPIYLSLPSPGHATNVTLVPAGSIWRYVDTGANLGTNWIAGAVNDQYWQSGPAPLGYGDPGLATTNSYGPNQNNKFITTYYRTRFLVRDADTFGELRLRLRRDDGAAVYLNGHPVFITNLRGEPAFDTLALVAVSGADETNFLSTFIPPSLLVEGTNVLAIEIHQCTNNSSDIVFDLELRGIQYRLPPTSANIPQPAPVPDGSPATLTVNHDGLSPFSYQWWFNGTNLLAGQTNSQLFLTNAQVAQSGTYIVVVSNRFSAVSSAPVNLVVAPPLCIDTNLVSAGDTWSYHDKAVNLATGWRALAYPDTAWSNGPAQFGFGDHDESTLLASNRQWTTYFRRKFQVADTSRVETLTAWLLRDDGAVVYLNDVEVWRSNMPATPVAYSTPASVAVSGADENLWFTTNLPTSTLRNGTNILAVELHQSDLNSTDLSFDFELSAVVRTLNEASLRVEFVAGNPILSWPIEAGMLTLVNTTNLAQPIPWEPVSVLPMLNESRWVLPLNNPTNMARFYRLQEYPAPPNP